NHYDSIQRTTAIESDVIKFNTDGVYDSVSHILYAKFDSLTRGTKYHALSVFYTDRDRHIDNNIISVIRHYKVQRILCYIGADHKVFAVNAIQNQFGNNFQFTDLRKIYHKP